jgi:hypothetical protein
MMKGFASTLKHAHENGNHLFDDRTARSFDSILQMIEQLPYHSIVSGNGSQEIGEEDVLEGEDGDPGEFMTALEHLKNKFKLLHIRLEMLQRRSSHKSHSNTSAGRDAHDSKSKDSMYF